MAAHPRTALLAAFASAFGGLALQPKLTMRLGKVDAEDLPALNVGPAEEPVEKYEHAAGFPTIRKFKVYAVCSGLSQEQADELAWQVEQAAPYETAGLGAVYAGSEFAVDEEGARPIYQTRVSFEVTYEASVS